MADTIFGKIARGEAPADCCGGTFGARHRSKAGMAEALAQSVVVEELD